MSRKFVLRSRSERGSIGQLHRCRRSLAATGFARPCRPRRARGLQKSTHTHIRSASTAVTARSWFITAARWGRVVVARSRSGQRARACRKEKNIIYPFVIGYAEAQRAIQSGSFDNRVEVGTNSAAALASILGAPPLNTRSGHRHNPANGSLRGWQIPLSRN
jgi:hypothetical protein